MLFNSYEFLFLFLPVVLAGYYLLRANTARLFFLTVMSYGFYGWWDYRFCGLMFLTTVIDYVAGLGIYRAQTQTGRKFWLLVSVVSGLSLLGFFKYFDLLARTANGTAGWLCGVPVQILPILNLILPIGISFYTFHSMSYAIDVYRGVVKPAQRFWEFSCFVSLFTQLVAGPIIRYRDLAQQLVQRTHTVEKASLGLFFFIMGLSKKVILADGVAPFIDKLMGLPDPGFIASWVGMLGYTMQIYFDFSGYSDMAVGLGYFFGFQIPINFNSPYKANSITDFWRRWHMSLSQWLRDYLYVSLGGNRLSPMRTYINLFLTMFLGGLWHGASWTFVLWGSYHGLWLIIERAAGKRSLLKGAPAFVQRALIFVIVLFGWVLFRCTSVSEAASIFSGLLGLHGWGLSFLGDSAQMGLNYVILGVALVIAFTAKNTWEMRWKSTPVTIVLMACLFGFCLGAILVNDSSPFLYFQF